MNKKEYFQAIIDNLEKWSPIKGGQTIHFDSREFLINRKEEFDLIASSIEKNQVQNKTKPSKFNQVLPIELVKPTAKSRDPTPAGSPENSSPNKYYQSPKIWRKHRQT